MNKKIFAIIGVATSAILILMGVLTICGVFGGDTSHSSGGYSYDYGYATFGGDFYTYVNNNAAKAAYASSAASSNVAELVDLLKNVCSIFMMGFGLFGVCHFGLILCDCIKVVAVKQEIEFVEEAEAENAESQETEETEVSEEDSV